MARILNEAIWYPEHVSRSARAKQHEETNRILKEAIWYPNKDDDSKTSRNAACTNKTM